MLTHVARFVKIERVFVKYALETLFLDGTRAQVLKHLFVLSPTRWQSKETRSLPRGQRIRLALEELGPGLRQAGARCSLPVAICCPTILVMN